MADKGCTICGAVWHTQTFCSRKPKKPINVRKAIADYSRPVVLKRSRIKPVGKQGIKWAETRREWILANGAYHPCHYCGIGLKPDTLTLDHKISRSRAPELRYVFSNLVPACGSCNYLKGSIAHDNYEHTCH